MKGRGKERKGSSIKHSGICYHLDIFFSASAPFGRVHKRPRKVLLITTAAKAAVCAMIQQMHNCVARQPAPGVSSDDSGCCSTVSLKMPLLPHEARSVPFPEVSYHLGWIHRELVSHQQGSAIHRSRRVSYRSFTFSWSQSPQYRGPLGPRPAENWFHSVLCWECRGPLEPRRVVYLPRGSKEDIANWKKVNKTNKSFSFFIRF